MCRPWVCVAGLERTVWTDLGPLPNGLWTPGSELPGAGYSESMFTLLGSFADLWGAVQKHKQRLVSNSLSPRRQRMAIRLLGRALTRSTGPGGGSNSSWMPG